MSDKYIFDIETYPNAFTFSVIRTDGMFPNSFEVSSRKNEMNRVFACLDYIKEQDASLVGFNNLAFDYPVLHKLLALRDSGKLPINGATIAKRAYKFAQEQIDSFKGKFPNTVKLNERYVNQVDLFKIHHFDNQAKMTSLKMLEFNMRESNIADLPYPVGTELKNHEIDVLLKYNMHDVMMTLAFYNHSLPLVEFREKLTHLYNRDFINHSDAKIGGDYFVMRLEEANIKLYTKDSEGKRVTRQSKRSSIDIGKCLFDYYDFKRPEFIAIQQWFSKQVITETKGVFSDIPEHLLGDVAKYAEMVIKKKKLVVDPITNEPTQSECDRFKKFYPCGWIDKVELKAKKKGVNQYSYWGCWKIAETLNVVVNGFRMDFGTGGIHGSLNSKIVQETKKYKIIDADVSSMYPNIAISNNVYPEHLSVKFCEIYKDVYEQRKSYPKSAPENAMLKLALNATYGNSNNKFSVFYDPVYTMKITINGQLSLCLLVEKLLEVKDTLLVGVNTDGVTVALDRDYQEEYDAACKQWESQVKLQLEFVEYSKMIIRDVNNYIAIYTDGKLKSKGAYEYKDLGWHKNHSSLIIPMAAEANMLSGVDVREFIMAHKEKFDFMLRTKVARSSRLVLVMEDEFGSPIDVPQQNICRYYPCKSGGKLVKIMPPLVEGGEERRLSIDSAWMVKPCNNIEDYVGDIDYDYYVAEADKLIIQRNK